MDRVELKEKAKKMIKGNLWYILKPVVIYAGITFALTLIAMLIDKASEIIEIGSIEYTQVQYGVVTSIVEFIVSFVGSVFSVGYAMYILSFVRGKKVELMDLVNFAKDNWVIAILVTLLAGINIALGTVLFIIPGIIAAMGLTFYKEVTADNPDLSVTEVLRKAWNITNGYKGDLFILGLSFIGWAMVAGLTFGILFIWLLPYITVTFTLAYESLKDKQKAN